MKRKQSLLVIDTPSSCNECVLCEEMHGYLPVCSLNRTLDLGNLGVYKVYETNRHPQCLLQPVEPLLEALELLDEQELQLNKNMKQGAILRYKLSKSNYELYNKLYKALGGSNE